MPLKGRYFQYFLNQCYNNVSIHLDRLQSLPSNRSELPGIKLIELQNVSLEQHKGPAEGQLDPNDADKELNCGTR